MHVLLKYSAALALALTLFSCGASKKTTSTSSEKGIREKYASLLNVPPSAINNTELYAFVDEWRGTPYEYGGCDQNGVDCSGFVNALYKEVYEVNLPRRTTDIYKRSNRVRKKKKLREGDLVFFDIKGKKSSHAGVYLTNGRFVHASSSNGVMISNLSNPYYVKYFCCGGRI